MNLALTLNYLYTKFERNDNKMNQRYCVAIMCVNVTDGKIIKFFDYESDTDVVHQVINDEYGEHLKNNSIELKLGLWNYSNNTRIEIPLLPFGSNYKTFNRQLNCYVNNWYNQMFMFKWFLEVEDELYETTLDEYINKKG